jgi:hypothetical protein
MMVLFFGLATPAAKSQSTSDLLPFVGEWMGSLSGLPIVLEIFENDGVLNATAWINGVKQNLEYLGFKTSIPGPYFWRESDKASICLFFENGRLKLAYFEKDTVRKITLTAI